MLAPLGPGLAAGRHPLEGFSFHLYLDQDIVVPDQVIDVGRGDVALQRERPQAAQVDDPHLNVQAVPDQIGDKLGGVFDRLAGPTDQDTLLLFEALDLSGNLPGRGRIRGNGVVQGNQLSLEIHFDQLAFALLEDDVHPPQKRAAAGRGDDPHPAGQVRQVRHSPLPCRSLETAGYEQVDFGKSARQLLDLWLRHVDQADPVVCLVADLVQYVPEGFLRIHDLRAGVLARIDDLLKSGREQADEGDFDTLAFDQNIGLDQPFPILLQRQIGAQQGKSGGPGPDPQGIQPEVELVVAQHHRVVPGRVQQIDHQAALVKVRQGRGAQRIPAVQDEGGGCRRELPQLEEQARQPAAIGFIVIGLGKDSPLQVVGVQDGQGAQLLSRGAAGDEGQDQHQPARSSNSLTHAGPPSICGRYHRDPAGTAPSPPRPPRRSSRAGRPASGPAERP